MIQFNVVQTPTNWREREFRRARAGWIRHYDADRMDLAGTFGFFVRYRSGRALIVTW